MAHCGNNAGRQSHRLLPRQAAVAVKLSGARGKIHRVALEFSAPCAAHNRRHIAGKRKEAKLRGSLDKSLIAFVFRNKIYCVQKQTQKLVRSLLPDRKLIGKLGKILRKRKRNDVLAQRKKDFLCSRFRNRVYSAFLLLNHKIGIAQKPGGSRVPAFRASHSVDKSPDYSELSGKQGNKSVAFTGRLLTNNNAVRFNNHSL